MLDSFLKITFITLTFFHIQKSFPLPFAKRKQTFINFTIACCLNPSAMFNSVFKLTDIKVIISGMQAITMRFSIFPEPIVVLVSELLFSLLLRNPDHFSFPRSLVILEISHIKVRVLVNLYSQPIPQIVLHFPFIYFAFQTGDHPLSMSFALKYRSYVNFAAIQCEFGSSKEVNIFKVGWVAVEGVETLKILGNGSGICRAKLNKFLLPNNNFLMHEFNCIFFYEIGVGFRQKFLFDSVVLFRSFFVFVHLAPVQSKYYYQSKRELSACKLTITFKQSKNRRE